jgi:hypothetical protein
VDGLLGSDELAGVVSYLKDRYKLSIANWTGAPILEPSLLGSRVRLRVRADKGIHARVTHWADQSGAGDPHRDVANATRTTQPVLVPSDAALADQPSLKFDSEFLDMGGAFSESITQPYTLAVIGYDSHSGTQNFLGKLNANDWYVTAYSGHYASSVGGVTLSSTPADDTTPKLLVFTYKGASSSIRVNGGAPDNGTMDANPLPALEVGGNTQGQAPLHGGIVEVALWKRELTSDELTQLHAWAHDKYGVA